MDLSKNAKSNRDSVELPLLKANILLEKLELSRTRINAAIKVWPDTKRTLQPALDAHDEIIRQVTELHEDLSQLWKQGHETHWK